MSHVVDQAYVETTFNPNFHCIMVKKYNGYQTEHNSVYCIFIEGKLQFRRESCWIAVGILTALFFNLSARDILPY